LPCITLCSKIDIYKSFLSPNILGSNFLHVYLLLKIKSCIIKLALLLAVLEGLRPDPCLSKDYFYVASINCCSYYYSAYLFN